MKIKFREPKISKSGKVQLQLINDIIEEYQNDGYVLTLRQLYYQLVSRSVVPNKQNEYSKLSTLLKEGRMGGIVDWDAIEDRLRQIHVPASFNSPKSILDAAIGQYQLPRMQGQPIYIEVWVEKDALSGVLSRVTKKYHIPILVNRGYSSVSAIFDSYNRFLKALKENKKIKILYLGDFDPSGIDMIRDIKSRICEFFEGSGDVFYYFKLLNIEEQVTFTKPYFEQGLDDDFSEQMAAYDWAVSKFEILPIALTRRQIRQFNPPPNPAKVTDPRAKEFIAKNGATSWEVDALRPDVLDNLLNTAILSNIDEQQYENILKKEKIDVQKLKNLKKHL